MNIRGRLDRLEHRWDGAPPRFTVWDVIAGGADPDDLDPDSRATLEAMLAGVSDGPVPDRIEAEISEVCHDRPTPEDESGTSPGTSPP